MSDLFLLDDAPARRFEPFALTRPVAELRAGALLLRERWERSLGVRAAGLVTADHLADFEEPWAPGVVTGTIRKGAVIANSRCAVSLAPGVEGDVWTCGGRIAAVRLARDVDTAELSAPAATLDGFAGASTRRVEVNGWWLDHVWDLVGRLTDMLTPDIEALGSPSRRLKRQDVVIAGEHGVFVEDGAHVEPQVYFDTAAGPVLVRRGATVQAFTRIVGPCAIGAESQVGGDKIASCSIGDTCKVHGEVNTAVFLGHANKGHDGFLGHSYLGRWVNLGAGTITSNLKNTYGPVHFPTPDGEVDTGLQFLGTFFGDHAKTGIGTSLNTGSVIGAGANVYGGAMPPKHVPPFAWGDTAPYATYRMDKFLEVASRMMVRRHVELTARQATMLRAAGDRARRMAS